jgi:hypothetical protein
MKWVADERGTRGRGPSQPPAKEAENRLWQIGGCGLAFDVRMVESDEAQSYNKRKVYIKKIL